mgnify:CR=1 FL=1
MVELTNKEFFQDLDQTIAAQLFEQTTYPWEILPLIKDFVLEVGPTLSVDEYDQVEEMYGSRKVQRSPRRQRSMDQRSLVQIQKCAQEHLSEEMH